MKKTQKLTHREDGIAPNVDLTEVVTVSKGFFEQKIHQKSALATVAWCNYTHSKGGSWECRTGLFPRFIIAGFNHEGCDLKRFRLRNLRGRWCIGPPPCSSSLVVGPTVGERGWGTWCRWPTLPIAMHMVLLLKSVSM